MNRANRGRARGFVAAVLLLLLACAGAIMLLAVPARQAGAQTETFEDGLYTVDGTVLQETGSDTSMADSAFSRPLHVVAKDGEMHVHATLLPIKTGALTGYVGTVASYPGYDGTKAPVDKQPVAATVLKTYSVTDEFNKLTGEYSDSVMAGRKYPKLVCMELDSSSRYLWMRIYTPLMEGLSKGNGTKYVRLELDYSTMERIGDTPSDEEEQKEAEQAAENQVPAYFSKLSSSIAKANKRLAKTSVYTKASLKKLRKVRNAAVAMYKAKKATSAQVAKQVKAINQAIKNLEKIKTKTKSSTKTTKSTSKTKTSSSTKKTSSKLKFASLEDGTYTIAGSMVKSDRKTASMADKGIDHSVGLQVKGGRYYLTLGLTSVSMNGTASYLSKLRYYKQGYTVASDGTPKGRVANAKVLSYQMRGGERVKDAYGTNYPAKVTFPLVARAKKDGCVPLRVFVPVMDAIAAGNGTQDVYLKLDTKSVVGGKRTVKAPKTTSSENTPTTSTASTSTQHAGTSLTASTLGGEDEDAPRASKATKRTEKVASLDGESADEASDLPELEEIDDTDVPLATSAQQTTVAAAANAPVVQTAATPAKQAPLKGCIVYVAAAAVAVAALVGAFAAFRKRARFGGGKR